MKALPVTRVSLLLGKEGEPGAELSLEEIEVALKRIEFGTEIVVLAATVDTVVSLTDDPALS